MRLPLQIDNIMIYQKIDFDQCACSSLINFEVTVLNEKVLIVIILIRLRISKQFQIQFSEEKFKIKHHNHQIRLNKKRKGGAHCLI